MRYFFRPSRQHPFITLFLTVLFIALSALLLSAHAKAVASMRETGLPAALRLMQIEKRAEVLREQNEAAQLQAALRTGTEEEILRLSVLPDDAAVDRLLPTLEVFFASLQEKGMLRAFPVVTVGDPVDHQFADKSWRTSPVQFTIITSEEGMAQFFSFIESAGMLTVSDLLSPQDIDRLLVLTEEQNPAAITALEQFLSSDLLRFAQSPRPFEDQLFAALSSPVFADELRSMLHQSARRAQLVLLSDLAPVLRTKHLWPMRFLAMQGVTIERLTDGWLRATVTVDASGRPKT